MILISMREAFNLKMNIAFVPIYCIIKHNASHFNILLNLFNHDMLLIHEIIIFERYFCFDIDRESKDCYTTLTKTYQDFIKIFN